MGTENIFIPPSSSPNKKDNKSTIIVSAPGYESKEIPVVKGDGTHKENLIVQLETLQDSLQQAKINSSLLTSDELKNLLKGSKPDTFFIQKKITDSIINVKSRLIPMILTLLSSFGITQANELISKGKDSIEDIKNQTKCPTSNELSKLINRKNKLVKQINNLLKVIRSVENAIKPQEIFIDTLKKLLPTLDIASMTLPTSVPPGIGIPSGVIIKLGDLIKSSKDLIKMNEGKINNLNSPLSLLKSSLATALQYLNLLDSLIQQCSPDASQEQISAELIALTTQQSVQLSPVVTNVNGFEMGVETEPTTNSLKRKRAIARNKQGIVMLKGEYSFSSIDQILIDELVFYIQQNDLKAE
jgi:hypothetical protein